MADVDVRFAALLRNSDKVLFRLSESKSSEIYRDTFALQNYYAKIERFPCQNFAKPR